MPNPDNSGASVPTAILIGVFLTFLGFYFTSDSGETAALLKDKEAKIQQLQHELLKCQYQYQGYRDGRR